MKISTFIVAATIAATFLGGCSKPVEPRTDISFRLTQLSQAYRMDGSAADYESDSDIVIACRAELMLPTDLYGNDAYALRDTLISRAFNITDSITDLKAELTAYFKSNVEEKGYSATEENLPQESSFNFTASYDGFFSVTIYPVTIFPEYLAFATTTESYPARAAHGMYSVTYQNYDIQAGKTVELTDLIRPECITAVTRLVIKKLKSLERIIGPVDATALPYRNNFYINSDEELVFVYQPYEIASYAQGIIRAPIPSYMLNDYLSDEGKRLFQLLNDC